ncbi:mitogen-activated protein kinase kinase kinase 19 isoform B [Alligator mississippiensis]|uniref:Mitogen-activated protein kinase kinase kinase 19 n=1 Tax=Alligator mississippiensis TaxID=8496 RepID=A0A151M0Q0_ALLMI|nr:mitogen-activated protein kinase kinase kinase 19 isoform B [Alligator mississippiensis]
MWIYLISLDGLTKYRPGELTEELQNNNRSFHSKHLQLLRNRTLCQIIRSCEVLKKSEDTMSENNQDEDSSNEGCEILVAFQNANKILKEMSKSYKILETNNQVTSVPRLWPDERLASFPKKRQLELKMSQQSSLPFFLKRTGNSRHPHGFDFSFLVQGPCSGSNMSKPLRGLDALQEINAQIQQRLSISVLKHSNRKTEFHLSPEALQPLRTVPLTPLENNRINQNTTHNKILSIMDSVPCPTKPIGRFQQYHSGSLQQGQTKHAVGQSRRHVSDSSITTGHLRSFGMDNYYKYFGDTKEEETEKNLNIGDLSTIKEVSLEQSLDIGAITNNPIFATTNQPFYDKGCAERVTPESNLLMTDQHKCVVQGRVDMDDSMSLEKNQVFCDLKDKNEALVASSFPDKLESESSQTELDQSWTDICENKNKELTDELLCCLAAGLLVLKEKDINSSRILTKNQGSKMQNMFAEEERCIVNGDGKVVTSEEQSYSEAFLASNRENDLLNFSDSTNLPESSSANDDPIMWTRGEILGKGAYGTVYCGLTSQGQLIAVKQVALDISDQVNTEKEYQKLQEEVDLLKTLKHINIVTYLGTCLANNVVSIFMEFVPGGSISSIIHRFGPLPEIVFCKYTTQILQGVAYLHENRVVHRDIKGNNVMLMPNGVIKLIDFGCAKRLAWVSLNGTQSELLNSVHGTPYWMAPEVINESGYGRKSDIWSIGCTVFEMATGKPPLASMNRIAAMFYIGAHRGLMPPLPDHFSGIAADFVHVCLTRDQHERPSALQLLEHPFIKGKQ